MLLLILLAVAQGPGVRPQYELTNYLIVAAAYGSANHTAALREIRGWQPSEIAAAVADLRRQGARLHAVPTSPDEIAFGTVEAAVLMHAEVGLAALQVMSFVDAGFHLDTSVDLFEWSRHAAAKARGRATMRKYLDRRSGRSPRSPALEIRERIDRRDFYQALAATALAIGFPATARPFALLARQEAPLNAEVQLVFGCVAEGFAEEKILRHLESEAPRLRDEADRALRDALALDPGLHEARLRLGRLLLVHGRLVEAEPLLQDVEQRSGDDRQRYMARLALAHVLERSTGPAAARPLVAASLAASRRLDRAADPWWLYPFGPPGLAEATLARLWERALGR